MREVKDADCGEWASHQVSFFLVGDPSDILSWRSTRAVSEAIKRWATLTSEAVDAFAVPAFGLTGSTRRWKRLWRRAEGEWSSTCEQIWLTKEHALLDTGSKVGLDLNIDMLTELRWLHTLAVLASDWVWSYWASDICCAYWNVDNTVALQALDEINRTFVLVQSMGQEIDLVQ